MWQIAKQEIIKRFEEKGYNTDINHDEIKEWAGIRIVGANEKITGREHNKLALDYVDVLSRIRMPLLKEHNIMLFPIPGKGFQILAPNEQIEKVPRRHWKKAKREITKAMAALTYIDEKLLNDENKEIRNRGLIKAGYMLTAFRKRKIE